MPDDDTEGVAEHSSRLQPSINLHAQSQPLCSVALVPNVLPQRDEGSGMPCAVIEALMLPYSILGPPTQDSNPGSWIQNHKR